MASDVEVIAVGAPAGVVRWAMQRISLLEQRWSRFLPFSDLTALNTAGGSPVQVHADTVRLVLAMLEGWALTEGLYDPRVLVSLVEAGYCASIEDPRARSALPPPAMPAWAAPLPTPIDLEASVEVGISTTTVRVAPGVGLDPGGIGKGLAADLVVGEMLESGCRGALVCIGGDLAAVGEPPDSAGWRIAVEDPRHGPDPFWLEIDGGGVATSSTLSRRWVHEGRERHHHIDPRTGDEALCAGLASVTVVARAGWLAEVHATAALQCGPSAAGYLRERALHGVVQGLDGWVEAVVADEVAAR